MYCLYTEPEIPDIEEEEEATGEGEGEGENTENTEANAEPDEEIQALPTSDTETSGKKGLYIIF